MWLLLLRLCVSVTYEVLGRTITISGNGVATETGVQGAGSYTKYELAIVESGITELGEKCFYTCQSLVEIRLPSSLEIIRRYAFAGTKIASLTIPAAVKLIEG